MSKHLSRAVERALVGGDERVNAAAVARFSKDPMFAAKIGAIRRRAHASFAAAFPDEVRETVISNIEWRINGYNSLADFNELMGNDGC